MNYNDVNKAITAEDLIRRYNLDNLKTDRKIINTMHTTLNRQHTIIKEFISFISPYCKQSNRITTWYGNGTPTLENFPFSEFVEEEKDLRIGDIYYDKETGEAYQLDKNETFEWTQLEDANLVKSLALANSEADVADNKRNVFYEKPITPYDIGDVWLNGNLIMRCRSSRSEGNYEDVDWIVQEDYSNELVLRDTRAVLDEFKMTIEKDYVTKVQLETTKDSITASVDSITKEIITTATQKYEYYDEELAQIKIETGEITAEVSEVKTNLGEEVKNLNSKIEVTAGEINQTITDNINDLSSRIQQTENQISSKVSQGEFGSYMQQYYDKFLVGFNNASKYIQIDVSGLGIYDGSINNSNLLMRLNQNGNGFYRDGYYVGSIGTSRWKDNNSYKGLSFDLQYQGKYMSWDAFDESGNNYFRLCYTRANSVYSEEGFHFGANVYGHNYSLSGFNMANSIANEYETVNNKSVPIITNIDVDEEGNLVWEKASLNVRSGMITSVPENATEI